MAIESSVEAPEAPGELSLAGGLIGSIDAGTVVIDWGRKAATLAGNAVRIFQPDLAEPASIPIEILPTSLTHLAEEARSSGKPLGERYVNVTLPGGTVLKLQVNTIPLTVGGQTLAAALVLRDLTSTTNLEQQLVQLDRLASLGTLAAGAAHEVKNALVACKTFIDLLLEKNQDAELAEIVRREMGRIDTLVSRMLKFAGRGVVNYGPIRVNEIIERSLRLLERQMEEKSIVVVRSLDAQPDLVLGDEHELHQALVNLLLNALEAMPLRGTLTATSAAAAPAPGSRHLMIAIHDTGAGIPPEVLSRLFEPFVTTKPNGTGLGLAITKQIVHHHRGTITARSHPGHGTTFTIVLPMLPPAA